MSKKGLFLDDQKAVEIREAEGFALKGRSKSKWLAYYMGIRSAVFDDWVRQQITDTEEPIAHSLRYRLFSCLSTSFLSIYEILAQSSIRDAV